MKLKRLLNDRYLMLLIIFAVIYVVFWVYWGVYRYQTYSSAYYDIGEYTYSMYWHIHFAQNISPLIYISTFSSHISLFLLLVLPIFYLYQSPITLFLIQDIFLAITAILVYFVTTEITNKKNFGFILAVAFLLNPGIVGLTYYDFHAEAFIPFFYILTFYAYLKGRRNLFIISLLSLLSIIESTFPLALTLLTALLVYEVLYARKLESKKDFVKKIRLVGLGFVITLIFALFYISVANAVTISLSTTSSSVVPPIIRTINFVSIASSAFSLQGQQYAILLYLSILGIFILFFDFGVSSMANPFISIILISPWLMETFVFHDLLFVSLGTQYYAYFVGASYAAATLGYLILSKTKIKFLGFIRIDIEKSVILISPYIIIFSVLISSTLIVIAVASLSTPSQLNYTQINNVIGLIPSNATVMAQISIAPHLYYIKNLEIPPIDNPIPSWPVNYTVTWFKPQYIIIDSKLLGYSGLVNSSGFNIYNYTNGNYTIYYNQSGLEILKEIN